MNSLRASSFSRRKLLQAGILGLCGVSLVDLLGAELAVRQTPASRLAGFGRAKSCIVLFLKGGPPQQDTFDPKPDAPGEIRGEFGIARTSVAGLHISDQLPKLAGQADKFAILRTLSHQDSTHSTAAFLVTTGRVFPRPGEAVASRDDPPHVGSIVAAADGGGRAALSYVMAPEQFVVNGEIRGGQGAGMLGARFEPLFPGGDPNLPGYRPAIFAGQAPVDRELLRSRQQLLETLDQRQGRDEPAVRSFGEMHQKALGVLERGVQKAAFELDAEPTSMRERYGRSTFGQSVLMARRLVESGVRLVQVNCMSSVRDLQRSWDLHANNFSTLRDVLLPRTDAAVAALLEDLAASGLLGETLVLMLGEFGRTPKINENAGRDHWPQAQSVLLAGAGIPGGTIFGATDGHGAFPKDLNVTPTELVATVLHALGIRPETELTTRDGRPFRACDARPRIEFWG